jgi:hypothetical protein
MTTPLLKKNKRCDVFLQGSNQDRKRRSKQKAKVDGDINDNSDGDVAIEDGKEKKRRWKRR